MNLPTKLILSFTVVLFSVTTLQNMNASNNFNSPDLDSLNKISLIEDYVEKSDIELSGFLNDEVSLNECKSIYKENDFKDFRYESCNTMINDLFISALDKKEANETKNENNALPSLI